MINSICMATVNSNTIKFCLTVVTYVVRKTYVDELFVFGYAERAMEVHDSVKFQTTLPWRGDSKQ